MNEQAQIAAILLAGFIAGGEPTGEPGLSASKANNSRPQIAHVSESSCRLLTRHKRRDDVTYQPGVGAGGKPVTPADIGSRLSFKMQPVYEFAVTIQPFPAASALQSETGMEVARVAYEPAKHRITINGEEQVWLHERALSDACQRQYGPEKDGKKAS